MPSLATFVGIGVVSCATLMLEILLTRITSVVAWYHLAFFVISLAMLGMTAGAVAVFMRPALFAPAHALARLHQASLAFALSIPAGVCVALVVPILPITTVMAFLALLLVGAALALPFWFSGVALTVALTRSGLRPGPAYAVDLLGAAAGCVLLIPLLAVVDAVSATLLSAALAAAGASAFAVAARRPVRRALVAAAALTLAALGNASLAVPPLRPVWVKGEREDLRDFDFVGWNTYSRVTVTRSEERPPDLWAAGRKARAEVEAPVAQRVVQIDGGAATTMVEFDGDLARHAYLDWDVSSVVHAVRPAGPVAVIGVGGGRDVLQAIRRGHSPVVGIEINDLIVDLHRTRLRGYSGLAGLRGVELVADEARSFLSRDRRSYAVIVMSLIDTWASSGAGAYTLSENGLYTVEAWRVFLARLQPGGVLSVSRWYKLESPGETARMVALAFETLASRGVPNPRDHVVLLVASSVATLLVSPDPFTGEDLARVREEARLRGFLVAGAPDRVPGHSLLAALWQAGSPEARRRIGAEQELDLTAPTDDRPFFFNMLKPATWLARWSDVDRLDFGFLGNLQATTTLLYGIGVALVLTVATIAVPLWRRREDVARLPRAPVVAAGAYFALIGLGFMYVEMGMLSLLNVYLGHPILGLAVVLGGLIAFTGIGSALSSRVPVERRAVALGYPLLPALAIFLTVAVVPGVVASGAGAATPVRVAVALLALAPGGLAMGLGFPLGLRLARAATAAGPNDAGEDALGPWLWGINGAFGVCASGLALATSMTYGVSATVVAGGLGYALLPLCTAVLSRRPASR